VSNSISPAEKFESQNLTFIPFFLIRSWQFPFGQKESWRKKKKNGETNFRHQASHKREILLLTTFQNLGLGVRLIGNES